MVVKGGIRLFVLANRHVYYALLILWFIFWWFIGGLFFYAYSNLGWDEPIPWDKFISFGLKGMIHPYSILFSSLITLILWWLTNEMGKKPEYLKFFFK